MKYLSLLLLFITAIAYPQAPGYGYVRGRVSLLRDYSVNSLPVRIDNDIVTTDENGYFISLCKSGALDIEFQNTILHVNLSANEILTTDIKALPVGVLIKNYQAGKMPKSATLNNEDITDIRYVNNSIWLPQCYKKNGHLTINHDNEFSVPYNSSSVYDVKNDNKLIILERKLQPSRKITINNYTKITGDKLSLRYLQGDKLWRTAVVDMQKEITNLPLNKYYLIKFNRTLKTISERVAVDLSARNEVVAFKNISLNHTSKQKLYYQDLNGNYQSTITFPCVNRVISDEGFTLSDNIKTAAAIEENTSFIMYNIDLPDQYTRYKWLVFEDNKWRMVESEWLSDNNIHPTGMINSLKSGTKVDFLAYNTTNYLPKIWHADDVTIPYPDYAPSVTMPVKFTDLPALKGKVTRGSGTLPPTSRLSISPIEIKPILRNLTPEIERDLRLYNVNFDIDTGDFNIILPGYGKYLLKFYTSDKSFPENEMTVDNNTEKIPVNFQLKQ